MSGVHGTNLGSTNGSAKLSDTAVAVARARYQSQQPRVTVRQLAVEYGVSYYAMWLAVKGRTWRHANAAVQRPGAEGAKVALAPRVGTANQ